MRQTMGANPSLPPCLSLQHFPIPFEKIIKKEKGIDIMPPVCYSFNLKVIKTVNIRRDECG
jgi:hypothetical protein